jgi:hypothetical protein
MQRAIFSARDSRFWVRIFIARLSSLCHPDRSGGTPAPSLALCRERPRSGAGEGQLRRDPLLRRDAIAHPQCGFDLRQFLQRDATRLPIDGVKRREREFDRWKCAL